MALRLGSTGLYDSVRSDLGKFERKYVENGALNERDVTEVTSEERLQLS